MEDTKTLRIELNGLKFFGHYGLYPVEKKWIQCIIVDICILLSISRKSDFKLEDSLDYQQIYSLTETVCKKSSELLETIGFNLVDELSKQFPQILELNITIAKEVQWSGPGLPVKIKFEYKNPKISGTTL